MFSLDAEEGITRAGCVEGVDDGAFIFLPDESASSELSLTRTTRIRLR